MEDLKGKALDRRMEIAGKLLTLFALANRVFKEVSPGEQRTGEGTTIARLRLWPCRAKRSIPGFDAAPGAGARPARLGPYYRGRPGGGCLRGRARGGSANARMVLQRAIGRRGPRYLRLPGNALARSRRLQDQVNKGGRSFTRECKKWTSGRMLKQQTLWRCWRRAKRGLIYNGREGPLWIGRRRRQIVIDP